MEPMVGIEPTTCSLRVRWRIYYGKSSKLMNPYVAGLTRFWKLIDFHLKSDEIIVVVVR